MIYLDNAATTFPKSENVYLRMDQVNRTLAMNAGRGSYKSAREATEIIDDVKCKLLKLVKASNGAEVIFTPSITIALNQILNGIAFEKNDIVYISPYEHNAVARVLEKIRNEIGIIVKVMPVDGVTQTVNLSLLRDMVIQDKPKCICCTHVSNVTGYILPIKSIFEIAKEVDAITVLDTAQSLGLLMVDMSDIDFLAFAGHKTLYGPLGIGGFITTGKIELRPYIVGGTGSNSLNLEMPSEGSGKYESSSFNIVAIAGLQAALDVLDVDENYKKEKEITEYAISKLSELYGVKMYLPANLAEHVGVISFNVQGYSADDIGTILDQEYNIAVRTGYHCAPYVHDVIGDKRHNGTIRIGLGRYNTKRDVDNLCEAIEELV